MAPATLSGVSGSSCGGEGGPPRAGGAVGGQPAQQPQHAETGGKLTHAAAAACGGARAGGAQLFSLRDAGLLRTAEVFAAGAAAGAVSRTATAPIDRVKMLLQAHHGRSGLSIGAAIERISAEAGWKAYFRGNGANCLKITPETAIKLSTNDRMKLWLYGRTHDLSAPERVVCGGLSGGIAQAAIYPLEVVRTRLAVAPPGTYHGIADCLFKVARAEGMLAWYRGLGAAMMGIFPYAGLDIAGFEMLKARAQETYGPHLPAHVILINGTLSSCFAQVVAYPLALVRTRLQTQGIGGRPEKYAGVRDAFVRILAEEGRAGLYRGLLPNFIKLAPAAALSWLTFEKVKEAFRVEEADASR